MEQANMSLNNYGDAVHFINKKITLQECDISLVDKSFCNIMNKDTDESYGFNS